MSNPAELLAMMTAHGIQITGVIPGGLSRLTALDVAGAMGIAHVPSHCQMLVLAKLCLDDNAKHQAWSFWFQDRMELYHRLDVERRPGQVENLCRYTLTEYLSPNACERCGGVGSLLLGELKRDCTRCRGTGKCYPGDRAMARMFDVDRRMYERVWAPRIADGRRELHRWEYEALVGLARGLGIGY